MVKAYSRGSEWRQWDLHIHSPASFHWDGERFGGDAARNDQLVDEMIAAINEAPPAVFALMDYWTFDGWFALKRRLAAPGAPVLTKTVFPGIELRLAAPMDARLNAHAVFSDEISDQYLRNFSSTLRLELIDQPLSNDALIEYARYVGQDKLKIHGFEKTIVDRDDSTALQAGYKIAEVNVDSYKNALRRVPDNKAFGFMPFSTNDGLAKVKWSEHYAYALSLFESSPIFETRKTDLWAAFCDIKTDGNREWITNFQSALKDIPRLAVSGSDAHCCRGNGTNDKRGYGDFPSGLRTWIKADPTWKGLTQALKEPGKRSFLGTTPPKLEKITQNKTFYIDRLKVKKNDDSTIGQTWLDGTEIPLNPDLVAVIGNKGSGKSALADIIALLGNSQQSAYFSFLKRDRFRGKAGEPARQFVGTLVWVAGDEYTMGLADDPSPERVELVRYIPQGRFEALCNEHVTGKTDFFEQELREVIFSHVPTDVRLDALSFDQLIDKQENSSRAQLNELRKSLRDLNDQIISLEDQLHPNVIANLYEKITLKEKELREHEETKPQAVEPPTEILTEEQKLASERLAEIADALERLSGETRQAHAKRQVVGQRQRSLKNILDRVELFKRQYESIAIELGEDLANVGLKLEDILTLTINNSTISIFSEQISEESAATAAIAERSSTTDAELRAEQKLLSAALNEPQQKYQMYIQILKEWQSAHDAIKGLITEPESLLGLKRRLEQIKLLPDRLAQKLEDRRNLTREIFNSLEEQRAGREALFDPLQKLIQRNELIREEYKLQFQARLVGSTDAIAENLFSMIKQARGELRGDDDSSAAIRSRFEKYVFDKSDDAAHFADDVAKLLSNNTGYTNVPGIRSLMRKDRRPEEVYNFLYGLTYLEPKYTLLFQETPIEHLSPGQRGALLLIFYLLVDKGRNPIVLDQPEENLDNETVVSLLVPVLNEAKKTRQIVMVTHNPNLAVVCDAEQVIHASFDRKNRSKISYNSGSIEDGTINRAVVDVLEGTKKAFNNRSQKYH